MSDREQFESWWERAHNNGNPPRLGWQHWRIGDGYLVDDDDEEFQWRWEAWQASREALKAEQGEDSELLASAKKLEQEVGDIAGRLKQSLDSGFMFIPVPDLYAISTPETKYFPSYTTYTPHAEDVSRAISDGCEIQEYVKLERLQDAMNSCPDYPEKLPCPVLLEPGLRFGKGVPTRTMLGTLQRRAEYYAELEAMTPEQRAKQHEDLRNFLNLNPIDTTPNQYDALGKGERK